MKQRSQVVVLNVRYLSTAVALMFAGVGTLRAQQTIPVRQLSEQVSSDTTVVMGIASVRHLPSGKVIVNDVTKRQLVLFDSTLKSHKVIADTSTNSPNSYGLRGNTGGLIPYLADSTLFVDMESQAFLVIDPNGVFTRVAAPTRASDLGYVTSGFYGMPAFDPKGRLIYRSQRRSPPSPFNPMGGTGKPTIIAQPDSAPLMRQDFDLRKVDTIGMIKVPVTKMMTISTTNMSMSSMVMNPLPSGDEWTMLADGTIAIVRAQDYHIDWLAIDGTLTSSPKMPFDWKRITLEEKQQIIDSVKKAAAEREAKAPPPPPPMPGMPAFPRIPFTTVEPADLPDYYPPVRQGQVRADREGNVWILPATSKTAKDGLLYDVVNRKGEIVERVQLPKGRTLVGFGPGSTIYMHWVISPTRAALERAVVVRNNSM